MSVNGRLIAVGEVSESASGFRWFVWSFSNGFCRLSLCPELVVRPASWQQEYCRA